jgi:uncharacterized protein YegP (UPF0339 family)
MQKGGMFMCWWRKKNKQKVDEAQKAQEAKEAEEAQKRETEQKVSLAIQSDQENKVEETVKEPAQAPAKEEVKTETIENKTQPQPKQQEVKKEAPAPKKEETVAPVDTASKKDDDSQEKVISVPKNVKPFGKYEVYPESGMFKFRLKANNGEILIVSNSYTTEAGAIAGIETFKKNVKINNSRIITDKAGYSQFKFFTSNGSRMLIDGEFYNSTKQAESALESTKKFAFTAKVVELKSIPASEVREEIVKTEPVEENTNGKLELFKEDKLFFARLLASNAEVLFVTDDYSNKASLLVGLKGIMEKVENPQSSFHIYRDKQNRYCFKLYSTTGQQVLVGQTYPSKDNAMSAIDSVRRFLANAQVSDLTVANTKDEKKEAASKSGKKATKKAEPKKK